MVVSILQLFDGVEAERFNGPGRKSLDGDSGLSVRDEMQWVGYQHGDECSRAFMGCERERGILPRVEA